MRTAFDPTRAVSDIRRVFFGKRTFIPIQSQPEQITKNLTAQFVFGARVFQIFHAHHHFSTLSTQ